MQRAQKRHPDKIAVASCNLTQEEINTAWLFREDGAGPSDAIPEKIRLIDDCRPINRAAGLREKLKVQSVDRFCSMVARAFQLHDAEKTGQPFPRLVGRALDLKAAYKQFGMLEDDCKWLRLVTWEPMPSSHYTGGEFHALQGRGVGLGIPPHLHQHLRHRPPHVVIVLDRVL